MTTLTMGMQLVLLAAGGITILAMLSVFANVIAHETQLHDLRNRVKELHYQHALYLARIDGQIPGEGEVEILPDEQTVKSDQDNPTPTSDAQSLPVEVEEKLPVAQAA